LGGGLGAPRAEGGEGVRGGGGGVVGGRWAARRGSHWGAAGRGQNDRAGVWDVAWRWTRRLAALAACKAMSFVCLSVGRTVGLLKYAPPHGILKEESVEGAVTPPTSSDHQ